MIRIPDTTPLNDDEMLFFVALTSSDRLILISSKSDLPKGEKVVKRSRGETPGPDLKRYIEVTNVEKPPEVWAAFVRIYDEALEVWFDQEFERSHEGLGY